MLRGGTADVGGGDCSTVPTVDSTAGSKDQSLDRRRTGMILNNIAVRREGIVYAQDGDKAEGNERKASALLS